MNIWIILVLVMLASFFVQRKLQSKFGDYSEILNTARMTGAQVAQKMLRDHGITDVTVTHVPGMLTDHFDPTNKTVNLSDEVYSSTSIAAAAVAAHECGHAVQHAQSYAPVKLRSALVPVVNFSSRIVQWVLLLGVIVVSTFPAVLWFGITLFAMSVLFSLVTLPVEINASKRALDWMSSNGVADSETLPMAQDALKWAAYTYVIAAIGSLATLLYYIGMARRN